MRSLQDIAFEKKREEAKQNAGLGWGNSTGGIAVTSPATRAPKRAQQLALQREEDEQFQQSQNDFAEQFGRGLTSGAASKRGQAGTQVQVNPKAVQGMNAPTETYWENNIGGASNNNVELAGMMNRGVQKMMAGDDAGIKEFLKGYNDGPWSSRTDAASVDISDDGMVTLLDANGEAINKTPVHAQELQNIVGNSLIGQNVNQRTGGGSMGGRFGGGGGGMGQPTMTKDAAKSGAENRYKTEADKYKKMFDAKDEITGKSAYTKDELSKQYNKVLSAERDAQSMMQAAGGLGQGADTPKQAYTLAQEMLDKGMPADQVMDNMFKLGADKNTMDILAQQLGGEPRGMQQPPNMDVPVTGLGGSGLAPQGGQGMQPTTPQGGQGMQPTTPQGGQGMQPPTNTKLGKIKADIAAQQKQAIAAEEQKMANKVFDKAYKKIRDDVYSNKAGTVEIEALYDNATPKQKKTLERLYGMAARKEARTPK